MRSRFVLGLVLATVFSLPSARAGEIMRYFESLDDGAKFWFLEYDQGKQEMALAKVTGVKNDFADHVFALTKDAGNPKKRRFGSAGATKFAIYDYDLYRLVSGTQKRIWQLYGARGNDVATDFIEKTPPASPTAKELRAEYEQHEQGAVPEAADASKIGAAAASKMEEDCKGKVTIQFSPSDFSGGAKPPVQRVMAVALGVADLCQTDEDYRKAVVDAGKIAVGVSTGAAVEFVKGSKPPMIKVAKDAPNTRGMTKKLLMEGI